MDVRADLLEELDFLVFLVFLVFLDFLDFLELLVFLGILDGQKDKKTIINRYQAWGLTIKQQ